MFFALMLATLAVALLVTHLVATLFRKPIARIFDRLIGEEIAGAWQRYVTFAVYVVGVSSGAQIWKLERFIETRGPDQAPPPALTAEHWFLEIYRTVIGSLQGVAWMLLVVFLVLLIAYVIVRGIESRRPPV